MLIQQQAADTCSLEHMQTDTMQPCRNLQGTPNSLITIRKLAPGPTVHGSLKLPCTPDQRRDSYLVHREYRRGSGTKALNKVRLLLRTQSKHRAPSV
jgi:hypothetical protein